MQIIHWFTLASFPFVDVPSESWQYLTWLLRGTIYRKCTKKKVNFWEQKPAVVYLQRKKRKKSWYITLHCPELLDLTLIAVKLLELKLVIYLLAATQDLSLQAARFYHSSINSPPNVNFQNTDLTEKCGETLPMSTKNEHNCMMKTLNT